MITPAAESLRLSDFDYRLPESLIAQEPCAVRDQSRLMVLDRGTEAVMHHVFADVEQYLVPGDLLVLNNTRVFPCRLPAKKPGNGKAEIFLLSETGVNRWNALVKGRPAMGKRLTVSGNIEAEIVADNDDGTKNIRFDGVPDIKALLDEIGKTPLPPYIKREPAGADRERYQTVYAVREGAVAAPTAGLHFTPELLQRLRAKGVQSTVITLHVGPGTFQPVKADIITDHRMLPEEYVIEPGAADSITRAKAEGRRVIAVGTTSVRTIESAAAGKDRIVPGRGRSGLFIYPGFRFRVTDGLITNFHLPKSTLLMLVSALAGRDRILAAYNAAISQKYRFYSYGDAMMIL